LEATIFGFVTAIDMTESFDSIILDRGIWKMVSTPDHQVYYYHTRTKETKWELDEGEVEEMVNDLKIMFEDKEGAHWKGLLSSWRMMRRTRSAGRCKTVTLALQDRL